MPEGTTIMESKPSPAGMAVVRQIDIEARARNWSRAELLRRADVSPSTYARYASGERDMGVDTLLLVAEALSLRPSVIMQRAEERFEEAFRPPTKSAEVETVEPAGEPRASSPRSPRPAPGGRAKRRGL